MILIIIISNPRIDPKNILKLQKILLNNNNNNNKKERGSRETTIKVHR